MNPADAWRVERTADGSPTLVHPLHGEACHSSDGAWTEAWERHVLACEIPRRAASGDTLTVLDVGTGPGLSLAALYAATEGARARTLVTTLELDPRVLQAGIELAQGEDPAAPWTRPWRTVADSLRIALAAAPSPTGIRAAPLGAGTLHLVLGDARETLVRLDPQQRFDVVFLDPFSPGVDGALWEPVFLTAIARRMAPAAVLSTYSAATAVRAGLAAAGLVLALGPRVGRKREGTLAGPELRGEPLPARVARRLERRARELPGLG